MKGLQIHDNCKDKHRLFASIPPIATQKSSNSTGFIRIGEHVFSCIAKHCFTNAFLSFLTPRKSKNRPWCTPPYEGFILRTKVSYEGFILRTKVSFYVRRFHSTYEGFVRRFHSPYEGFILRTKVSYGTTQGASSIHFALLTLPET